ncbi:hypothetical protein QJS10_CPB13g01636 [Acorus calamus]|uniref:HMA domain-containing protein n=2 Tax=Magnoliopsida TaxID=3398 RepID=A0AAV9DH79_ACOCL|nr:hypothetical protein QJS10_CPB13g01636 [Acorus calamus]
MYLSRLIIATWRSMRSQEGHATMETESLGRANEKATRGGCQGQWFCVATARDLVVVDGSTSKECTPLTLTTHGGKTTNGRTVHPSEGPSSLPKPSLGEGSSKSQDEKIEYLEFEYVVIAEKQKTVVLKVGMSCEGCVGAVKRVLNKMEGVESYDVDIKEQKVTRVGRDAPSRPRGHGFKARLYPIGHRGCLSPLRA